MMLLVMMMLLSGCGEKEAAIPEPLDRSTLVQSLRSHFADSEGRVKEQLEAFLARFEAGQLLPAFRDLDKLILNPDLDQDSRNLLARASLTISTMIDEAAAKGDNAARELNKNRMLYK